MQLGNQLSGGRLGGEVYQVYKVNIMTRKDINGYVLEDASDSDDEQDVYYECNEHDDGKGSDFLFKDSYFEDRELDGLEYCYEPGIALGHMEYGTDLAPMYRKVSSSGVVHCLGCRCQRMSQFGPYSGCHGESGLHYKYNDTQSEISS